MWRILNGISRGLRNRTPAPPSQTASRSDENDLSNINDLVTEVGGESKPAGNLHTQHESHQFKDAHEITQRILGTPSEADILLREFFGPSWKDRNSNDQANGSHRCGNIPNHILSGFGLGTVWMTALIVGRAVFSSWRTHHRRAQISCDGFSTWQEFEDSRFGGTEHQRRLFPWNCPYVKRKFQTSRLHVLPEALSNPSVLAAGNESEGKTFQIGAPGLQPRLGSVQPLTKPQLKEKSVTFDEEYEDSASSSSASSVSEEALERFTEDAKECSGAIFCILGLQSIKAGNYKEAFERFQLGADEGYPKALFNLGLCYERGHGTKRDFSKAIDAYEKAAYKGHIKAQYNLGLHLIKSENLADKVRAIRLLENAAMSGLTRAQALLGAYLTKPGDLQDFKKAVKMFRLASEQGDPASKYHLGICYERGLGGLKQDLSMAFDLYSAAASAEHLDAKYQMAVMLEAGFTGLERNPNLAQELLTSAAKLGHRPSITLLEEKDYATRNVPIGENNVGHEKVFTIRYTPGAVLHNRSKTEINRPKKTAHRPRKLTDNGQTTQGKNSLNLTPGFDGTMTTVMPDILSRHAALAKVLGSAAENSPRLLSSRTNALDLKPELSDALAEILRLPRPATSPNLRRPGTALNEHPNVFSLEV